MRSQDEDALFGDVAGETLSLETGAARVLPGESRGGLQVKSLMVSSIHALRAKTFTFRPGFERGRFDRIFLTFVHET